MSTEGAAEHNSAGRSVFLSYARDDKAIVSQLQDQLAAENHIDVWRDEKDLRLGDRWRDRITRAFETASAVIICLSSAYRNLDRFCHKEMKFALEYAKRRPSDAPFVLPVAVGRMSDRDIPTPVESLDIQPLYKAESEEIDETRVEELRKRLAECRRIPVPPELQRWFNSYLDFQVELSSAKLLPIIEFLCLLLLMLLIFEVGILQEWAPPSQHPGGFPGWHSRETGVAVLLSLLAAVMGGGWHVLFCGFRLLPSGLDPEEIAGRGKAWQKWLRGHIQGIAAARAKALSENWPIFALLAFAVFFVGLLSTALPLLPLAHNIDGKRFGDVQVLKALGVTWFEMLILVWPAWFYSLWVRRDMPHHEPIHIPSGIMLILAMIGVTVFGYAQWQVWRNPSTLGYGDAWHGAHMLAQAILMSLLALNAVILCAMAEWLHRRRDQLMREVDDELARMAHRVQLSAAYAHAATPPQEADPAPE